ncbi:flagellar basal-body rod modification protein FlgD [Paraburkholderia tropica]|uniref:Basal-body rod modification protein FlgD n=2 Tax=Burkholderiaceae TaxID=119060 RepID=A0A1A5WZX0_9BURK|nr:flagellar basal-body rod modification protein FlgD [Paraburkholderia tropica]MBB2998442.1 flagellar basal-body rod modification protein FlgD [Paraburkholderia tropica]MBB6317484.1 flagellar basal-body rod modification protein FlgD [Paraburkholderia tropica]OBR46772.1 flagellar biosynthesis protein FlgD [Paraburkholderia tropica]PXX15361.1 flagellar basal-body rod modification protein FlgD [Paraburkholderia tropica]
MTSSSTTIGGSSATVSQSLLDTMNGTSSSSSTSSSSGTSGTSGSDLQNTFLQLLVAQLKNQDPTDPMDSSQMTSQLAQINTVSGIANLNTSLTSLSTQLSAGQNAQAALLIGSTVLASGTTATVSSGSAPQLGVQLTSAASDVKLTITNSAGKVVNTLDLGAQSAGTVPITWNGTDASGATVADGDYTVSASATINGQAATATALVASKVQAVIQQTDGTASLSLANGKTVALSSVAGIL